MSIRPDPSDFEKTTPVVSDGVRLKVSDEELILAYKDLGSFTAVGQKFGMNRAGVHKRLQKVGASNPINVFRPEEVERLKNEYEDAANAANAGKLNELAASMGRTRQFICRQAGKIGLTKRDRAKPYLIPGMSERSKAWIASNGHPRGSLGMKHTKETKRLISESSKLMWRSMSDEERSSHIEGQLKAKIAKHGSIVGYSAHGSWKSSWRSIGDQTRFYRSAWEANYARYLEMKRLNGEIASWCHEPETFWFPEVKSGVRTYLPDFLVTENDGSVSYHEVKGWMDERSQKTIGQFREFYPQNRLIVIDGTGYRKIASEFSCEIEGWE